MKRMPLFKRYEKIGEWTEKTNEKPLTKLGRLFKLDENGSEWWRTRYDTKKKEEYRVNFSFPSNEPLVPFLTNWIETIKEYLFPGYKGRHLSYIRAYQILTSIEIYPHWLRAQRASCLIAFYEWKMEEMMEWMGWEELTTARMYAKLGVKRLTMKMAGKQYPDEALERQKEIIERSYY